ncbi:MAG TPA: glycoside hydrolase domain-containing protein [Terracidiphilus sp.]|jgi:Domain of unknown function (DUF1906)
MMKTILLFYALTLAYLAALAPAQGLYSGFDRNDYPGDATMISLRKTFQYTSYWLNKPPGANRNSWAGKRSFIQQQGFGFLVLFNGRLSTELVGKDATSLGRSDGNAAVDAALQEGFQGNIRIFLDQEEGGRLLREQGEYILSWIYAVNQRGARAGVYCSGIDVPDGSSRINTAEDIEKLVSAGAKPSQQASTNELRFWVANDQCPPAPGCTRTNLPPSLGARLHEPERIEVWQYALSPRRTQFSSSCPRNAAGDGNCYAPGLPQNSTTFIDLDVSNSPDPSETP